MEKPNADIEWYDDGLSWEQQKIWAQAINWYKRNSNIYHLTDNEAMKQADKLISKLKIELAAANEYISELEELNNVPKDWKAIVSNNELLIDRNNWLEKRHAEQKQIITKINNKYTSDMQTLLREEVVKEKLSKLQEQNKELQDKCKRYKEINESLITEIIKLKNNETASRNY